MFEKIAQFIRSKNKRERIMLLCVVLTLIFAWASMMSSKNTELGDEMQKLQARKTTANTIISQEAQIKAELEKIQKVFDVSKTIDAVNLQIAAENCARAARLTYSISTSTTKDAGKFKIHSLTISIQKNDLKLYARFEKEISKLEPYVTLSRTTLDGDGKGGVIGRYTISSFEMAD